MHVANVSEVGELADWSNGWCISAFLSMHQVLGSDGGDALRLRNVLRAAETELVELGMRRSQAAGLLTGVMPRELGDPKSEVFHKGGVAIFVAPGIQRTYRLALETCESLTTARRFHLKPLLRELEHDARFFILAVTRGYAQLFAGAVNGLEPVDLPDMPTSLEDATQYDDRERALLSHSASRRGVGGVVAAFHGQGDRADHLLEDTARYLRMVDASVRRRVGHSTPIVLAGSRNLVAFYRELSSLRLLAEQEILGNPQTMARADLHARAWSIVDAPAARSPHRDVAGFRRLHGTGLASSALATVIDAARRGRVRAMFVAADTQRWGRFDDETSEPDLHDARMPGDEDLLDRAAVDAWKAGATVHVVPRAEMPTAADIAAVFRY